MSDAFSYEIYLWQGGTSTNLSNSENNDAEADISGSNVVWRHCATRFCDEADYEIYMTTFYVGCGDGLVVDPEECDDNNTASGDGCDGICEVEPGWTCEGEPSVCTELPLPVPSVSPGGLALLAGLVLGTVAWARRGR